MCVGDIVISRNCYVKETQIFNGVLLTVEPNLDRIGIRIDGAATGNINAAVATTATGASAGVGALVYRSISSASGDVIGQINLHMSLVADGPIIQGRLFILVNGTNPKLLETIMTPELARAVRRAEDKLLHGG